MCSSYTDLHFNHKQNQIPPVPAALPVAFLVVDVSVIAVKTLCNFLSKP